MPLEAVQRISSLDMPDGLSQRRAAQSMQKQDFEQALQHTQEKTYKMMSGLISQGGKAALIGGESYDPMRMMQSLTDMLGLEAEGRTQAALAHAANAQIEGNELMRMGVAAGFLGKSVDGEVNILSYDGDTKPKVSYTLPPYLRRASFVVMDASGTEVLNEYPLHVTPGPATIEWDGTIRGGDGALTGAPKGAYNLAIRTVDHGGKEAAVPVYRPRTIASVDVQGDLRFFDEGGQVIGGIDNITRLQEVTSAA